MTATSNTLLVAMKKDIPMYFWSRCPGRFVECRTGTETGKRFSGTVQEWYDELARLIVEVLAYEMIFSEGTELKVSHEVKTILQHTHFYNHDTKKLSDTKISLKKNVNKDIQIIEIYKRNKHMANIRVLDLCIL